MRIHYIVLGMVALILIVRPLVILIDDAQLVGAFLDGVNGVVADNGLIGAIDDDARLLRAAKWIAARVGDAAGTPSPTGRPGSRPRRRHR